jgi:hypothetical protein
MPIFLKSPAWRNWRTRWTKNLVFALRGVFAPSYGCEQERTVMTKNDRGTVNTVSTALARDPVSTLLIAVRVCPRARACRWRLYVDVDSLWLRLRGVRINDWSLRLARCVGVHVHNLVTSISNFAVTKFDNAAVLENNLEIRTIPRSTSDETMRVFKLLVRTAAADRIGTAKDSHNLLPRHSGFEIRHLLAGCAG